MKAIFLFFLFGISFCDTAKTTLEPPVAPAVVLAASTTDSIDFKTQIQPVLQEHCNPCHFPGGKMYEKMPFDQAQTILGHRTGVFKRIKAEKEVALFEQFYAQAGVK